MKRSDFLGDLESRVQQYVVPCRSTATVLLLRLAALTLQRCRDDADRARAVAAFAGDNRAVADYLVAEVLGRLPEDLRRYAVEVYLGVKPWTPGWRST